MLAWVGVGLLTIAWGFCIVLVLGLVIIAGRAFGEDEYNNITRAVNLAIGLGIGLILAIAPLVILIILECH